MDKATIDDIRDDLQAMDARYMRELHNHMDTLKKVERLEEEIEIYKQTFITFCTKTDNMNEDEVEACLKGWLDNERNKAEKVNESKTTDSNPGPTFVCKGE